MHAAETEDIRAKQYSKTPVKAIAGEDLNRAHIESAKGHLSFKYNGVYRIFIEGSGGNTNTPHCVSGLDLVVPSRPPQTPQSPMLRAEAVNKRLNL